jgi:DNA-directed RNA polymerase subunit F
MATPQFIKESAISLVEAKEIVKAIEKRDTEMGYLSNKTKEYLDAFVNLSKSKKEELSKKLVDLDLTRLKDDHISKITDFLPTTANDLKIVLLGYHMSLPKKDMDGIIAVVKEFAP